ncbi:MAG: transcriptional repressor [Bdellovibrionales bacterium]|nr:transcriptional repressor [Bdellovibrionales bacterium]
MKSHHKAERSSQDEIRAAGLKLTPARLHVLEILKRDHCLLTIDEIVQKLSRSSSKSADWTTVYRTLLTFADAGLVTPTTLVDGALRYEYSHPSEDKHSHHHHHVSCKKCGKIESIEACEIEKIQKQIEKMGFRELSHRLEFTGVCPKCRLS